MPLYGFKCKKCKKITDSLEHIGTEKVPCADMRCSGTAYRVIDAMAGYHMRGRNNGSSVTPRASGSFKRSKNK